MKTILVVVGATRRERIAEALRAALGLSLRGDRLEVIVLERARAAIERPDPDIARALATLRLLGHRIRSDGGELGRLLRTADAVEVWS